MIQAVHCELGLNALPAFPFPEFLDNESSELSPNPTRNSFSSWTLVQ